MNVIEIGVVRSPVLEARDHDWGSIVSEIHLKPEYVPGLRGIEQFSHLVILFYMHDAGFDPNTDLVRRPRGRADMPRVGIFAQRARHRPTPMGISTVQLISVESGVLEVRGLDAIDGTPVLDLKPYFPAFDRVEEATVPDWVGPLMKDYF
jgi:tRNA (adenine37-N6)-methyltransferase